MAQAVGMDQTVWSRWERTPPEALMLLRQIAEYHQVSADYLLGLTDDPVRREALPLPAPVQDLVHLVRDLSGARQEELLAHARVLAEAERAADLREYDRMMALVLALPEGEILRESVEEALRAGATGDTAAALRVIDAYLAGRAAKTQPHEQQVEQT